MRYMALPVSFRWDEEFVRRIDEARGLVPRSAFVRAAVEQALEGSVPSAAPPARVASPAPAEQPDAFVKRDPSTGEITAKLPTDSAFGRVRSSAAARPFRPVPKGKA